jgi:hypothetical protein
VKKKNYAPVQKTGQTKCYDTRGVEIVCSGTGQDGDFQKGVAWPNPRFTDNGNGTVKDNLTGLIWLKNASCTSFFSSDNTGQNNRTWPNALTAANSLEYGYCGLTDGSFSGDWRLPNVKELQSLIDFGRWNPVLPSGHLFTGVQSSNYWSSTTSVFGTRAAWHVDMNYGPSFNAHGSSTYYVWPVRGGK